MKQNTVSIKTQNFYLALTIHCRNLEKMLKKLKKGTDDYITCEKDYQECRDVLFCLESFDEKGNSQLVEVKVKNKKKKLINEDNFKQLEQKGFIPDLNGQKMTQLINKRKAENI